MSKLIFVENPFQLQLAQQIKDEKKIYYLKGLKYTKLIKIPFIVFLILQNKNIYIYDHRNIILILALTIDLLVKRNIYVADEGFHTLLVDKFKTKYLYRRTHVIKRFFLWLYQNKILQCKRYKQIPRKINKEEVICNSQYAVFVDQSDFELSLQQEIKEIQYRYNSFDFAKHPRNKRYNIFNYSRSSFEKLLNPIPRKDFYGVYSTGLIYALKNKHNVLLINSESINSEIEDLELEYIKDIQEILIDMGARFTK
jgi:hypothetical protein